MSVEIPKPLRHQGLLGALLHHGEARGAATIVVPAGS